MPGTLYVIATPIGNLEDLTFRALRILREVDLIAAEDTRRTAKLLAHYEIRKPLVSLREHNEARETPRLLDRIAGGERIGLVSDAGTPTIADPGTRLVRAAHQRGLTVVPIPGPSAVTAALSASGLAEGEFIFMGFPPSSGSGRLKWLERLAAESRVAIFFEAPHRIRRTLADVTAKVGQKTIFVARELSKKHEELVIQQNNSAVEISERGEFTIVVSGPGPVEAPEPVDLVETLTLFGRLTEVAGFDEAVAYDVMSVLLKSERDALRKAVKKARILVNQQKLTLP